MNQTLKKISTFILVSTITIVSIIVLNAYITRSTEQLTKDSDVAHMIIGKPLVHLGDHKPVTQLYIGESFYVWNRFDKPVSCRISGSTWFIDKVNKIDFNVNTYSSWHNAGVYEYNNLLVVDSNLPPGQYHIVKKSVSWCNGFVTYVTNYDIPVKLVRKPVQ